MNVKQDDKPLYWIASARKDLKTFPEDVVDSIGFRLRLIQRGYTPDRAKPLKGFGGKGLYEIVEDFDTDTYRVIYTVRFRKAVYVLHTFMKKAHHGIRTPQKELDVIRYRLKAAEEDYLKRYPED